MPQTLKRTYNLRNRVVNASALSSSHINQAGTVSDKRPYIYTLPAEVIQQILSYLVPKGETLSFGSAFKLEATSAHYRLILYWRVSSSSLRATKNLSLVSKRMNDHCNDLLYAENIFQFSDLARFDSFSSMIRVHNTQRIRSLEIRNIHFDKAKAPRQLLRRLRLLADMPNLTILRLREVGQPVWHESGDTFVCDSAIWSKIDYQIVRAAVKDHPTLSSAQLFYNPVERILTICKSACHYRTQLNEVEIDIDISDAEAESRNESEPRCKRQRRLV